MNAHVEVDSAELRRALRYVGDQGLKDALKAANKDSANIVAEAAMPHVPVRSGRLKASLRATGSQRAGSVVIGGARVPYAAAIHWGRKRGGIIKGRPFITDAAAHQQGRVVDAFERAIDRLLDKLRGR